MKKIYLLLFIIISFNCFSQSIKIKDVRIASGMFEVNGKMLFAADTGAFLEDLWVSDGTTGGTHPLKKFSSGMFPASSVGYQNYQPVVFNGSLFFLADDDGFGLALWKSDATINGTVKVKSFGPNMTGPYFDSYPFFCILNNEMFFAAGDNSHGVELWKTDGTTNNTVLVKDIAADNTLGSQPAALTVFNNEVYFSCWTETYGVEIWKSDGTDIGTTILKDIFPGHRGVTDDGYGGSIDPQFIVSGNYLFFTGRKDTINNDVYQYRTDGTPQGTIVLDTTNIRYDPLDYHKPYQADLNGTFMYMANGSLGNSSLYKSDGTPAGTVNVVTGNNFTILGNLYPFNGKLYFHSQQGPNYSENGLGVSDGTTGGSSQVVSFPYISSSPDIAGYVNNGSSFFFRALMTVKASTTEWRMVQSNGTADGTHIYFGAYPFGSFTYFQRAIYYLGIDSAKGDTFSLYKLPLISNLGVHETVASGEVINAFPNPADESFLINTPSGENGINSFDVYNLVGEKIYTLQQATSGSAINVDVSGWRNGIYLGEFRQNNFIKKIKLVVQH